VVRPATFSALSETWSLDLGACSLSAYTETDRTTTPRCRERHNLHSTPLNHTWGVDLDRDIRQAS